MLFSIWRVKKPYGSLNCREEGREKPVSMPCDCFFCFFLLLSMFLGFLPWLPAFGQAGRGVFLFDFQHSGRPDGAAPLR